MQGKEFYILLDVLFAEVPYVEIIQKEIRNELLTVEEPQIMVSVPSLESILGDKMTAFAPHTTGIPIGAGKSLEIAKQLFDVAVLIDGMVHQQTVQHTYRNTVSEELA